MKTGKTELEEIMANLKDAVGNGELTKEQAKELLNDFQDHEYESYPELVFRQKHPVPSIPGGHVVTER